MAGRAKNIVIILLGMLLLLSAAIGGYFIWQNMQLQDSVKSLLAKQADSEARLQELGRQQTLLQAGYERTKSELDAEKANVSASAARVALLQSQLSEKERQLAESRVDLEAQQQKAASIASDLSRLEGSINESMSWFRENAALPENYGANLNLFKGRMYTDCVDGNELNLACISYLMENTAFAIHYRTDAESSGRADFLQSLKQTIDSGWGDCEDYSLIFKAELNTLKAAHKGLEPIAFTGGGTAEFRVYPKESTPGSQGESYWYVPNAKKVPLGTLDSLYPYVVCFRQTAQNGHCAVALSDREITKSSEMGNLAGARVFEPQTGQYLGTVGSEFSICQSSQCFAEYRAIMMAISDSDLYKFEGGEWAGYADYAERVRQETQALVG